MGKIYEENLTESDVFDKEMMSLQNFIKFQEKNMIKEIENHLSNYVLYRTMSFYENWTKTLLIMAYNGLIKYQTELPGKIFVKTLDNSPDSLQDHIAKILSMKYVKIKISKEFHFLKLLDDGVTLESDLQIILEKYGGWYPLFKKVNQQRNSLTHELDNYELDIKPLELFLLYREFFKLLSLFLTKLFPLILNDENITKADNDIWTDECKKIIGEINLRGNKRKHILEIKTLTELKNIFKFWNKK